MWGGCAAEAGISRGGGRCSNHGRHVCHPLGLAWVRARRAIVELTEGSPHGPFGFVLQDSRPRSTRYLSMIVMNEAPDSVICQSRTGSVQGVVRAVRGPKAPELPRCREILPLVLYERVAVLIAIVGPFLHRHIEFQPTVIFRTQKGFRLAKIFMLHIQALTLFKFDPVSIAVKCNRCSPVVSNVFSTPRFNLRVFNALL